MRVSLAAAFVFAASVAANPALALKRVPYPEVRVVALPAFDGDAGGENEGGGQ